ncbi:MAG TPA: hypothetical protein VHW95_11340 [Steroidobacteraceae bacterium]|jgi:hypothetical protein|nr:hypothetical protein [Steroidobacteraceae bacterium]
MTGRRTLCRLMLAAAAALLSIGARADNFGRVRYDGQTDQLIVAMIYRGSNPNHTFSLKWGKCRIHQSGDLPGVTLEVLDDQFQDRALQEYTKEVRFDLTGLPCPRPVSISLTTAPRFFHTLTIPGR